MPDETKPSATQTQVTLRRDETSNQVMAHIAIGKQPLTIDQHWLAGELDRAGLKGAIISKSGILQLRRMLASGEAGKVPIGECHDATVELRLSEDRLTAKLILKTARGGAPVSPEHLDEVIDHAGISRDLLDHKAVERLLAAAPGATPGATLQIVIARGKAAIDGENSRFEPLVQASERRPAKRADGSLDYRDLGAIPTVKPGDPLMRRHPPTTGVDGIDLQGKTIKATNGRQLQFNRHRGTLVSEEDPNLLVAKISGQPVLQQSGASVDPVLTIDDVNMRSGHIDYDGTLLVRGSVSPGMRIQVSGDVRIMGMVECANLEIGGNLDVKMGIVGPNNEAKQEGLSMRLRCEGNLSAGHVEKAELDVNGDIAIKSQLTHSQVRCDHQIVVGSTSQPRSGIVGGRTQAGKLIRAQTLGAEAGITTEAMIQTSTEILRLLEDKSANVDCKQADLARLLKMMVDLSKSQAPDKDARLKKINDTCDALKAELSAITVERDSLQRKVDAIMESRIEVPGTVYSRVFITIGDKTHEVTHSAQEVCFRLVEGRLRQRPLEPK